NALDEVRQTAGQSLRWGDADQWHLTLAFRPDLPEGAVPDALDDLAAMASGHGPLTLHLSGAGSFSGRTLWIGVGGEVSRLGSLGPPPAPPARGGAAPPGRCPHGTRPGSCWPSRSGPCPSTGGRRGSPPSWSWWPPISARAASAGRCTRCSAPCRSAPDHRAI